MLTCNNISYKDRFHGLGFSLTPGALLAVYGADATGLIMLMAGTLKPTSGVITFEDKPIGMSPDYKELSLYIPNTDCHSREGENPSLLRRFRAALDARFHGQDIFSETVEKAVKRLAKAGGGATELVEAALRYWGLTDKRAEPCKILHPHLQKRILLTQLLTLSRPIWLLDYPEQHLDAEGLGMLDALLANRCNQDGIVVLATGREKFMEPLPMLIMSDFA